MQISPKEELISSTISSLSNHHLPIAPYTKLGFTSLHTVNKNKPYIPYSDCVLKHILHSLDLTNQEKLFYLIADSLSLISGQNATKKRSAALPATKWAKNLNCSKNEIFTMQKSLEAKGYFIVIRDKNEFGKNQRNIIIPSLPDTVFHYLSKALNRSNNELTDNSPITSLTSSLAFPHCLNIEKNKRVYLDKTKLFIRLNYQLLLLIASSDQLTSFAKVLWLDFYTKCYKYHMKLKNTDTGNDNNNFACTTSYKELETKYSCTKATLSKTMNVLEKLGFIDKKRFHVKNDNKDDNLHDKSLWNVTLSLPKELALNILNLKPRLEYAYQANSKPNISSTDPYVANCGQLLNKDIKSNTKDSDSIDSRKSFFEKTNISSPKNLSELSISYKNSLENKTKEFLLEKEQKIVSSKTTPPIINIQNSILKTETSNNLEEGKLKAIEEISETVRKEQEKTLLLNQVNEQNNEQEQINTTNGVINTMAEMPVTSTTNLPNNSSSYNKSLSCNKQSTQDKSLNSFYPLTKEQVDKLNQLSNREFSNNFANQLLLKLYIRDPNKTFASTNHMISYMSKAFRYEKHQAPMVNHETFRFIANVSDPESVEMRQKEKYLSEVEYSIDTSYCSQLRKKIAGMFETKLAYQILTEGEFDYHATNDQEISQALEIKNDFYQNLELSEENNITKFEHVPNYSTCFVDSSLSLTSKHDIANIDYDNQLSTNVTENDQMKSSIVTIENDDINNNIPTRELYGLSLKSLPARQFTNITLSNTCTVKLPRDLTLTNYQQQNLEKAISTVYGYVKIVYQQLPAIYKKLGSSRLPDEIFLAELDKNSVWYKIRKKLIDNFDEYIDKAWFSKLRAEEDAITQKLTLIAPTNFLRDWINAKYSSFIKDIAKKLDYQFVELITKKQSLCNVI